MEKKYFKEFKYMPYTGSKYTREFVRYNSWLVKYPTLLSTKRGD